MTAICNFGCSSASMCSGRCQPYRIRPAYSRSYQAALDDDETGYSSLARTGASVLARQQAREVAAYRRQLEETHLAKILSQGGFPVFSADWTAWLWPMRARRTAA